MRKSLLLLTFILSLLFTPPALASTHFKDVDNVNHAYAIPSINFMVDKGILSGYDDGTFKPDRYVDKSEFTLMIYKLFDKLRRSSNPCLDSNSKFEYADVPAGHWARKPILDIYGLDATGVVELRGDLPPYFHPDTQITRWDALHMLGYVLKGTGIGYDDTMALEIVMNLKLKDIKIKRVEPNTIISYNSADKTIYYDDTREHFGFDCGFSDDYDTIRYIAYMVGAKIMSTWNGKLEVNDKITRAQAVVLLHRLYNEVKSVGYLSPISSK
ncbi:S-layer homology domain-containing protein [Brevibacillus reuszeri]|uniref:S-layer homology domain-containing protein n=1 Tax=Brevibacillus reuszeri TaxID=54915 RepID=UPI003D1E9DEF